MGKAIFFKDKDFRTSLHELAVGRYDVGALANDSISSVRVPEGLKVTLYGDANFQGRSVELYDDCDDLRSPAFNFDNQTSSILVEEVKAVFYQDFFFGGRAYELGVGRHTISGGTVTVRPGDSLGGIAARELGDAARWSDLYALNRVVIGPNPDVIQIGMVLRLPERLFENDSISSVRFPPTYQVILFEDADFRGRSIILNTSAQSLGDSAFQFDDLTSSIIVERAPRVMLYSDPEYSGQRVVLSPGSHTIPNFLNNAISSVRVPAGYEVVLFDDDTYKGKMAFLTGDTPNLASMGCNDMTSSLLILRSQEPSPPSLEEVHALIQRVAPRVYFHPVDPFGPSSVEWFLQRATLCQRGGASQPAQSPLPRGGGDDGQFWLVANDEAARRGNFDSAVAYVNVKQQRLWLDIQYWFFFPYNGAGTAEVAGRRISLGPMGQHGGDWEHVTCRINLITRAPYAVYFAQHGGGEWVRYGGTDLEDGRPVIYSSFRGHAFYRSQGDNKSYTVLLNSTRKGDKLLDCQARYRLLRVAFLKDGGQAQLAPPAWMQYNRRWGAHSKFDTENLRTSLSEINVLMSQTGVPIYKSVWELIPDAFKEENGPVGPWMTGSWTGDE